MRLEIQEELKDNFSNFPQIFHKILADVIDSMKTCAEEEGKMSQPWKMSILSFSLQNGTLITPLSLFYLQLGLVCTKKHGIAGYTPGKCFNRFVLSAVYARRQRDKNPVSSVVAETKKLLANSSYGYQMMDRSRYDVID